MNSLINESEDPAQQLAQLRQRVAELESALQEGETRQREMEDRLGQTQQKYMEILESSTSGTALAESERKYHDLINSFDEGFCIIEVLFDDNDHPLDYRFLEVNQAFERQTGLVQAAGRCMREMAPEHEQHWFDIYGRIALTGEPARFCNRVQILGFFYNVYAFRVGKPEQRRVAILFNDIRELMEAEDALRKCEEKYRTLFESALFGFVIVEPLFDENEKVKDLRYLKVNPAFEKVTGLRKVDFLGKRLREALPGMEPEWLEILEQVVKSGQPAQFEDYNHDTDQWYEIVAFPNFNGLLGQQFINITQRKRLEQQQALLAEISKELIGLTTIPETMERLGEKIGRYLGVVWCMFNESTEDGEYQDAYGWNAEEVKSVSGHYRNRDFVSDEQIARNNAGELTIVHDTHTDLRVNAELLDTMGIRSFVVVPICRSGQWLFQFNIVHNKPRVWREHEIDLLRDIADRVWTRLERVRAEEEVRQARDFLEERVAERTRELALERQRLFDVLETLPANICLISPDHRILFSNGAFRQRYGETDGRHCYDYIYSLNQPCEGCQSLSPLVTGQPIHWTFTAPDGAIIDAYDFPFIDMDGTTKILEMSTDITQQKKMEAELARLDRLNLIGQMAAGIGHEIRNPMTAVRGFLQMLGDKPEYSNDLVFFELMIEELDRANAIISEFLGLARDKMVHLQPGSLKKVVKALYPMIRSDANLREIDIKLDLHSAPQVLIDRNEIRQLILNMCRNAMEAMSSHGTLTISTRPEGDEVILYIRDQGCGLPPQIIDKLGTPFVTTKDNGTGLGLAICYSIAARHNARIDFETGPEGTTFYVRFPISNNLAAHQVEKDRGGSLTIPSPQPKARFTLI